MHFLTDATLGAITITLYVVADILRMIWRDAGRKVDDLMAVAEATREQHERVATRDELAAARERRHGHH